MPKLKQVIQCEKVPKWDGQMPCMLLRCFRSTPVRERMPKPGISKDLFPTTQMTFDDMAGVKVTKKHVPGKLVEPKVRLWGTNISTPIFTPIFGQNNCLLFFTFSNQMDRDRTPGQRPKRQQKQRRFLNQVHHLHHNHQDNTNQHLQRYLHSGVTYVTYAANNVFLLALYFLLFSKTFKITLLSRKMIRMSSLLVKHLPPAH